MHSHLSHLCVSMFVCECRPLECMCEGPCKHYLIAVMLRGPPCQLPGLWELKPTLLAGTKGSPPLPLAPLPQPPLPQPTSQQKGPRGLNSQATI